MKQKINRFVYVLTGLTSLVIVAFATIYLLKVGFRNGETLFRSLMGIAWLLLITSMIFALRKRAVDWQERPEKKARLLISRWLLGFLVIVTIPLELFYFF